jgi:hypothetical protein
MRDRPASTPRLGQCDRCKQTFIGADWHFYCGECVEIVANEEAEMRMRHRLPSPKESA